MTLEQLNQEFERWHYPKDKIKCMLETRDENDAIAIIWNKDIIKMIETIKELSTIISNNVSINSLCDWEKDIIDRSEWFYSNCYEYYSRDK